MSNFDTTLQALLVDHLDGRLDPGQSQKLAVLLTVPHNLEFARSLAHTDAFFHALCGSRPIHMIAAQIRLCNAATPPTVRQIQPADGIHRLLRLLGFPAAGIVLVALLVTGAWYWTTPSNALEAASSLADPGRIYGPKTWTRSDGCRIILSPEAVMNIRPSSGRYELVRGRINCEITQTSSGSLDIVTEHGLVSGVHGEFLVQADTESVWLGVISGEIRLVGETGTTSLIRGQQGMFSDGKPKPVIHWDDSRPIVGMILANGMNPPFNPHGWFNDGRTDFRGKAGLASFHLRIRQAFSAAIDTAHAQHAVGMLIWDIEGHGPSAPQYPGDPRLLPRLAPEMDMIADELFANCTAVGLATGVRIGVLPWREESDGRLRWAPDDRASLDEASARIAYARTRWGCSIFFLAHNLTATGLAEFDGGHLTDAERQATPASLVCALQSRFPNCRFIVEHPTRDVWAHAAVLLDPRQAELFNTARQRWPAARALLPETVTGRPQEYIPLIMSIP